MRNRGAGERRGFRLRRCSALARRDDILIHRTVNCAPAKRCVWPDLAPAQALVGAGAVRRGAVVLSRRFDLGLCLPSRFCRGVCVRFTPVSFPLSGKERRLAMCCVSILPWVGIAIRAFSNDVRLSDVVGSLRVCVLLYGDPDGGRRDARNGVGGAAQGRFCADTLAVSCFPRGVRWGCAPQTAPKSHWLSGLSSCESRRGRICQTSQ